MKERRVWERFDPLDCELDVTVNLNGEEIPGVVSNISQGGLCLVLMGDVGLAMDEKVSFDFCGQRASGVVRNITSDMVTLAYGLEWTEVPNLILH